MIVAFDMDGVLAGLDVPTLEMIRSIKDAEARYNEEKIYYLSRPVILDPRKFLHPTADVAIIITARPKRVQRATYVWLSQHFPGLQIRLPVLFAESFTDFTVGPDAWSNVRTPEDATALLHLTAYAKAQAIRSVGAPIYFEDTGEVVEELRRLLPSVIIVHFAGKHANVIRERAK